MLPSQKSDFQALFRSQGGPHLSCYLENHGSLSDLIRQLDQALEKAEGELLGAYPEDEVRGFLKPLVMLKQDPALLSKVGGHVGLFRKEKFFRIMSIPVDVAFSSIVASSFHVKPLLRWQQMDQSFFLIGLSDQKWTLYHGTRFHLRNIPMEDIARLRALGDFIGGLPFLQRPPVYLVGTLRQTLRFRKRFPFLVTRRIRHLKSFDLKELGDICFHIRRQLKAEYRQRMQDAFEEYEDARELGLASSQLSVITKEAVQGHVRRLIVADAPKIFGKLNWQTGDYTMHSEDIDHEDDDLLDDLAQIVLAKGGEVLVASAGEIDPKTPALAILHPRSHRFLRPAALGKLMRTHKFPDAVPMRI